MKQLALIAAVLLAGVIYGQDIPNVGYEYRYGPNHEATPVKGCGFVEIGGKYQATATNRDYPAFKEVVEKFLAILDSNDVSWKDYTYIDIDTDGLGIDNLEALHFSIATEAYLEAQWVLERTDSIIITATLFLYSTGYRLEVSPKHLQ